jgi:hypothetical protein
LFFRQLYQLPDTGLNFNRRIQPAHSDRRDRKRSIIVASK